MYRTTDKYILKNKIQEDEDGNRRLVYTEVPNAYYEGLLGKEQKKMIGIYKMAIEDMLTSVSNLDINSEDFYDAGFLINRVDFNKVETELLEDEKNVATKEPKEPVNDETKLITVIFKNTVSNMLNGLNDYIISLIDDMDEDEYNKRLLDTFDEEELKECNMI